MFKKLFGTFATVLLAVTVSGCAQPSSSAQAASTASIYSQKLVTTNCGGLLCGTIKVPVDWAKPTGPTFKLAFTYKPVAGVKKYLFINPGGPGASGVAFVRDNLTSIGTKALRKAYNIVGFDPRGTEGSSPVKCYDAAGKDDFLYNDTGFLVGSPGERAATKTAITKFVAACKKNSGPLLAHIDTVSAAKDLDVLRAVFKQSKLDYLGFSYGTFLGTTYATLFPTKVGRFVLDGAVDPTVSDEDQSFNQLKGFDLALHNYMTDCINNQTDCPFHGTVAQGLAKISDLLTKVELEPLTTTSGRPGGYAVVSTGMYLTLYSNDYWGYLTQAFNQAFDSNSADTFLQLADFYNDRNANGTYNSNEFEAFIAVSCLDGRSDASASAQAAQNARMIAASPTLGRYWQNGAELCARWAYPAVKPPKSYAAKGAPTIMVIGTTGDPATPYQQSVHLAHGVLAKGFLLTFQGEGHTAYGRSNTCVSNTVDNFLINAKLPAREPRC